MFANILTKEWITYTYDSLPPNTNKDYVTETQYKILKGQLAGYAI